MKKTVALHNLGCKVNAYELEAIQQLLENRGYEIVPFAPGADVYIINTCTVTNIADRKSRQMLHKAKKMNPDAVVVACGCYVQAAGEKLEEDTAIDLIIGNNKKKDLVDILENFLAEREDSRFGKQICVLSEDLKGTLEPNILYSVELKPMHKANGYVVVAATPVLFQAHVETVIVPKTLYQVTVTFGNKKIFFDPKDGKSVMSRTIDGVLEILKGRKDIKYKEGVITDYLNQARALVRRMESDGFIYTGDRHQGGIQ